MTIQSIIPPVSGAHQNEVIKIKLEVDTAPPDGAEYTVKYSVQPVPYNVRVFSVASLFAGKIHALLCRSWNGGRMKGRDLYDYIWYIKQNIPLNLLHLRHRLVQTGHLGPNEPLTREKVLVRLHEKFDQIDYKQVKADIAPFIRDPGESDVWSDDFFKAISERLVLSDNK